MKLAQALTERASLNRRIEQLQHRLQKNALVQEGEQPAEQPAALLQELNGCLGELETLILQINLTNAATKTADGQTLTALLAKRDCLALRVRVMEDFLNIASQTASRARGTEIKVKSTVPVAEQQKRQDALSKQLRELDAQIQELNWTTELMA